MSNSTDPAFPTKADGTNTGLTKREYIATELMKALLSNPVYAQKASGRSDVASEALACADALLGQFS